MSAIEPVATPLTEVQARQLTDEIRTAAERTWDLLTEAHEREAWAVLGYPTFAEYAAAEFGMTGRNAYRLLNQGQVIRAIEEAAGVTRASQAISARQALELAPKVVNLKRAIKRELKTHPDEPAEDIVNRAIRRATKRERDAPPSQGPSACASPAGTVAAEPSAGATAPAGPAPCPADPAPSVATREHLRALALTPAVALAMINRTELRAVQAVISEALRIQDPHPSATTETACPHPRDKRQNLGYAIKCGACGDVVKR